MFNKFEQAGVSVPIKLKFLWTNHFSVHRDKLNAFVLFCNAIMNSLQKDKFGKKL